MYRNIDVKTEMRKLTGSKPVHAVAGAGVLASQTLRDLPGRLARWGADNPVTSLPGRASGYVHTAWSDAAGYVHTARSNATGYVHTARSRAVGSYDALAARGKKALNGQSHTTRSASHATSAKSAQTAQSKTAANGKGKGTAASRASDSASN